MRVDFPSWHFDYQHDTPLNRALRDRDPSRVREPEFFKFSSADKLLKHLDGPGDADRSRFQQSIDKRLKQDANVAAIKAARTLLRNLKHFPAYRGRQYDTYHGAARRIASGTDTEKDRTLTDGLDAEIAASKISLDPDQILFHGRCNDQLATEHPYPSYVSTTLDPIVALNSAYRRAGVNNVNGRPTVMVLKLSVPLRALWGHVGSSAEWELLLPRGIDWKMTKCRSGNAFDVVHVEAIASPATPGNTSADSQ